MHSHGTGYFYLNADGGCRTSSRAVVVSRWREEQSCGRAQASSHDLVSADGDLPFAADEVAKIRPCNVGGLVCESRRELAGDLFHWLSVT